MFRSLYSVYCLCVNVAVLLPPGVNPFAVKYIYIYISISISKTKGKEIRLSTRTAEGQSVVY